MGIRSIGKVLDFHESGWRQNGSKVFGMNLHALGYGGSTACWFFNCPYQIISRWNKNQAHFSREVQGANFSHQFLFNHEWSFEFANSSQCHNSEVTRMPIVSTKASETFSHPGGNSLSLRHSRLLTRKAAIIETLLPSRSESYCLDAKMTLMPSCWLWACVWLRSYDRGVTPA